MKKRVLCYGDSNTWGTIAGWTEAPSPGRYDGQTRWPCVLARRLGEAYCILEEGLPGRNTVFDDPDPAKNGEPALLPCLRAHSPVDVVVLMLGTNDLKLIFEPADDRLADGIARLIDIIRQHPECGTGGVPPQILVVSPIHMARPEGRQDFYRARGEEAGVRRSMLFASAYQRVAAEKGCFFLDAAQYAKPDPADGLHLTRESHPALGEALAEKIKEIYQ